MCSSSYNNNDHGDGNELVSVEVVSVAAAWTVVMAGGGDNGGDGSLCLLLVVVLTVCRRKVVSFRISMAPWGSYLVHKSDLQCVIKSFP